MFLFFFAFICCNMFTHFPSCTFSFVSAVVKYIWILTSLVIWVIAAFSLEKMLYITLKLNTLPVSGSVVMATDDCSSPGSQFNSWANKWLSQLLSKTQGQLSSSPAIPMLCPWMVGPGPDTWWLSSLRAPRIHLHNDQFHLLILARLYASETFGQPWGKLHFNSQVHPHLPWWCCLQEALLGLLGGWWCLPLPDELDGTRCSHMGLTERRAILCS